jgi:Rrf2 family protein
VKLSKTATQAALALAYLAQQSEAKLSTRAKDVAEHLKIPLDSALKVLQALVRQNLLASQLGRSGGYRLELEPEQVTLLQIVEAVDGPLGTRLPLGHADEHLADPLAKLAELCETSVQGIRSTLDTLTVADLAGQPVA